MYRRRIAHQRLDAVENPAAVAVQLVKAARARQHFQRPLADGFQIDPPREIKQGHERLVAARRHDEAHRLHADILQRPQPVMQHPVPDGECRL